MESPGSTFAQLRNAPKTTKASSPAAQQKALHVSQEKIVEYGSTIIMCAAEPARFSLGQRD
jgi:hypothetical protein